ncbi:universal stress protein [Streptomyces chromofuscus]|uniref:Universal stress protein n=1 Tax=Streptomyces chromofuscus TaxID=42881 RepID=A0A7M2T7K0_STRCW|nr:universal stress protein [Streptomyces chromofuscus]QOV44686.1 universal stress protein [Streptomyces chromofuscus]
MSRTVTVGLDDSPESRAAAEWAAREALLRGLPLKIVYAQEPTPKQVARTPLLDLDSYRHWAQQLTQEAADGIRLRHPGIEVTTEQLTGTVADVLCEAAGFAELLVLGSRGLGGLGGFMVGSVSLGVVARAERPVVLVRAQEQATDEHRTDPAGVPSAAAPFRPVVLGLDIDHPDDTLLEFAFDAAARREAALRVIHAWPAPATSFYRFAGDVELHDTFERGQASLLSKVLRAWRQKFPDVEVIEASRCGSAAQVLVNGSRDASLVVVGRQIRTGSFGAHIGHVTHAALHHITAPVAVVAHS